MILPQWIKTVLALSLQRADANRIYSNFEVEPIYLAAQQAALLISNFKSYQQLKLHKSFF